MTTTLTTGDRKVIGLAVHEAGHAVVGTIFGATVDHAVLIDDGDDGLCRFTNSIRGATPNRYRPEIAAAGAVAAAVFRHGPRPRLHQVEQLLGPGDHRELRLAAMTNSAPFTAPITAVMPLVTRCWDSITDLAATLAQGGEIRHGDVCTALGLSADTAKAAFQLAYIRSGGWLGGSSSMS